MRIGKQVFRWCLTLGLLLAAFNLIWAQNASKPAMFRVDPRHTGVYEELPIKAGKLKWRFKTGGKVRSTPAIVEGVAYFGSEDGHLYAVDVQNGQLKWKFKTEGDLSSSPAVADGLVYFTGGDGQFYALEAKSGQQCWKFQTGLILPFYAMPGDPRTWDYYLSSPTIDGDALYVGSGDGNLYALERRTGKLKWKFQTEGRVRTSPAIADGVVYVGSFDNSLYAVDQQTGQLKWKFQVGAPIQSSPAVGEGMVYFGARDAFLHAVDIHTGQERWKADHQGSWVVTSPAVYAGRVFAGSSDGQFFQALDAKTGVEKWRFKAEGNIFSSPAIAGGLVYFGAFNVRLSILDAKEGKLQSLTVAESAINSCPVIANGVLYFGSDDNCLYAIQGEPFREHKEITLEAAALDALVGEYQLSPDMTLVVTREGSNLMTQASGQMKVQLFPESPTEFFMKGMDIQLSFTKNEAGQATQVTIHQGGQDLTAKKIK